jgi:hypothetical protein
LRFPAKKNPDLAVKIANPKQNEEQYYNRQRTFIFYIKLFEIIITAFISRM